MVVGKVDSASVDTSVAVPSPSSSKPAVAKPGQPRKEQSKSLNASAPSFNPPVRGRAPPRAPSVSSPRVRPPSVASTVSARSNQQQQQQRVPRPAPEPRGYIPAEVKTTRKSEADVDARILAARIKAEDARKKYEAAEAERIAYEKQVQEEQTAAVEKAEKDRKQQEEMSAYREAARQRKLKAMTESSIDTESNGHGGGGYVKEESSPASAPLVELDDDDEEATILRQLEQIRLAKAKKQEERRASEEEAAKREKAKRLAALRQQLEAETADLYGSTTGSAISESKSAIHKFEKRRGADAAYSPGYGVRGPNEQSHLPLPPDEERVTEHGSIHRVYPAPAPLGKINNPDEGWGDEISKDSPVSPARSSAREDERGSRSGGGWANPHQEERDLTINIAQKRGHEPPPHLQTDDGYGHSRGSTAASTAIQTPKTASAGAYVAWEGVTYKDKDALADLDNEKYDIKNAFADRERERDAMRGGDRYGGGQRGGMGGYGQRDSGYGNRGGNNNGENGRGGNGDSWDSGKPSGGGGWDNAADSYGGTGYGGGYGGGGGGGGDDGCRICQEPGHWAKECPKKDQCLNCGENGHRRSECDKGPKCRRCEQFGHMSYDCSEPRQGSGGGGLRGQCYNCGNVGHNRADCDKPVVNSKFFGECNNCGERGHRSRDCTKESTGGGGGGGYGGGEYGGGGYGSGGGGYNFGGGYGGGDHQADNGYGSRSAGNGHKGDSWGGNTGDNGDNGGDDWGTSANKPLDDKAADDGGWGGDDNKTVRNARHRDDDATRMSQSNNNDWGTPAPSDNRASRPRDAYDSRSNGGRAQDDRSRGSVQVDSQVKSRVAAFINPDRMRMAGMTAEQVTAPRGRSEAGDLPRQDRYVRDDAQQGRGQDRGREREREFRYDGSERGSNGNGGRYGQEASRQDDRDTYNRRDATPPRRQECRDPTPPPRREERRDPSPARRRERSPEPAPAKEDDEFGGW